MVIISSNIGQPSDKVTYTRLDSFDNHKLGDANKKVIATAVRENWKRKKNLQRTEQQL